jgi:uncharacterized membrane protein
MYMNIDKTKVGKYLIFIAAILGIIKNISSYYGVHIPDQDIDFWTNIVGQIAALFGIAVDTGVMGNLVKGKGSNADEQRI